MFTFFQEAYNSLLQHPQVDQSVSWSIRELAVCNLAYPQVVSPTCPVTVTVKLICKIVLFHKYKTISAV